MAAPRPSRASFWAPGEAPARCEVCEWSAVKVDRATRLGNPFVVGVDGRAAECVEKHRMLLGGYICLSCKAGVDIQRRHAKAVATAIDGLRGKILAFWCRLDKPCHAETLLEIANR